MGGAMVGVRVPRVKMVTSSTENTVFIMVSRCQRAEVFLIYHWDWNPGALLQLQSRWGLLETFPSLSKSDATNLLDQTATKVILASCQIFQARQLLELFQSAILTTAPLASDQYSPKFFFLYSLRTGIARLSYFDLDCWLQPDNAPQPTVLRFFADSQVYQCIRTHKLTKLSRSPCRLQKL